MSGAVVRLGNSAVSWDSSTQKVVTLSTGEAVTGPLIRNPILRNGGKLIFSAPLSTGTYI